MESPENQSNNNNYDLWSETGGSGGIESSSALRGPMATQVLKGFEFMNNVDEGWDQIEARFDQLAVMGILNKSKFGECIGTSKVTELLLLIYFCCVWLVRK